MHIKLQFESEPFIWGVGVSETLCKEMTDRALWNTIMTRRTVHPSAPF